jgi:hypothetical protein
MLALLTLFRAGTWGGCCVDALSQNHTDFAARVARIERQSAASIQLLYVGLDEVHAMPRGNRKLRQSRGQVLVGNLLYPLSMVAAVVLGAVSHMIGQVVRFHVSGLPDLKANPDIETLAQIILGIVISMGLGYALALNSKAFLSLKSAGVVVGVLFGHNAVHLAPQAFAAVTSQMWVNLVVTTTDRGSMVWRGISFMF